MESLFFLVQEHKVRPNKSECSSGRKINSKCSRQLTQVINKVVEFGAFANKFTAAHNLSEGVLYMTAAINAVVKAVEEKICQWVSHHYFNLSILLVKNYSTSIYEHIHVL